MPSKTPGRRSGSQSKGRVQVLDFLVAAAAARAMATQADAVVAEKANEFQITPGTARMTFGSSVQVFFTARICAKGKATDRSRIATHRKPQFQNQTGPSWRRMVRAGTPRPSRGHLISVRRNSNN